MARFSGRVIVPNVAIGAAVLVRPSRVRSAHAEAIASGSGSSCIMMSTRSASSKCARTRSTRARVTARSRAGSSTAVATAAGDSATRGSAPAGAVSARTTSGADGATRRIAATTAAWRARSMARSTGSLPVRNARR